MKNILILLFSLPLLILSGCAGPAVKEASITSIETPTGINSAYILDGQKKGVICASRGSDFARAQSGGFSLGVAGIDKVGESSSAELLSLGGMNSNVLLARETFYRTCEFLANMNSVGFLNQAMAEELFERTLSSVVKMTLHFNSLAAGTAPVSVGVSSSAPVIGSTHGKPKSRPNANGPIGNTPTVVPPAPDNTPTTVSQASNSPSVVSNNPSVETLVACTGNTEFDKCVHGEKNTCLDPNDSKKEVLGDDIGVCGKEPK